MSNYVILSREQLISLMITVVDIDGMENAYEKTKQNTANFLIGFFYNGKFYVHKGHPDQSDASSELRYLNGGTSNI